MNLFQSTAVAVALATPVLAETAAPDALSTLRGTYESTGAEPWYGGFGHREFVFADGNWTLTFTHALDPDMALRTFQFRTGGSYAVGSPSDAVEGAFRTVFREDWKHLTLLTPDPALATAFGMADCGLTVNLETDISSTGCAAWRPVAECGEDHDILASDPSGLRFGVRPDDNDMCSADKTPTALLPAVVKRLPLD
ncbi:hypothetical protein EI545_12935 [Tabrizicola piscis]|uniref:DUF1349 domain-containing protein n=1 Tax=Tabrizicola piscis TaxID=2494374 RepID=A0A3S8U7N1_9RHOB|nr:hypothetical protein [Tabrizicola piscis]AZL59656.1 hypothetical protein EI545_12935 [Tabrizicola piscis]